jgi:hypothetical protein
MSRLPSLAALSLDTRTITSIQYDDQDVNPASIPESQEFNLLLIQNNSLLNVFGIKEQADKPLGVRGYLVKLRQQAFFDSMTDAISRGMIFIPNNLPEFFVRTLGIGSSTTWDTAFPVTSPGLSKRAEGTYNVTYEVDIKQLDRPAKEKLANLPQIQTGRVAFRKSKLANSYVKINRVLLELAMQARMSHLGIGPKVYVAWCTPLPTPVPPLAKDMIKHVCSISELFDGDLRSVFFVDNDIRRAQLNSDVVSRLENKQHGFWKAVAKCIVLGASHGILHFDLKGQNMLYKRIYPNPANPNDYYYEVRYTDFDSDFFKVLDMENPRIKSREICFGLLSLCQLLAFNRCWLENETFVNSAGATVGIDWDVVFEIALDTFLHEYEERNGAYENYDITELCSFGPPLTWAGVPSLGGVKERLNYQLRRWARHYLASRACIKILPEDYFQEIADKIFKFAEADAGYESGD